MKMRRRACRKAFFPLEFQRVRLALVLLCFGLIAGCGKPGGPTPPAANRSTAVSAANTATNSSVGEAMLHKAAFEDRPNLGRDPFFPNSSRRVQQVARAQGEISRPKLPFSSYLKLSGLAAGKARPLAVINSSVFSPGERGEVAISFTNAQNTVEMKEVQVRCLEIRKDSVLISVEGESGVKELRVP